MIGRYIGLQKPVVKMDTTILWRIDVLQGLLHKAGQKLPHGKASPAGQYQMVFSHQNDVIFSSRCNAGRLSFDHHPQ